jgi:glycosyltransferase involved in cell wall biosynthesis
MEAYGFFCAAAFKIIERYLVGKPDCIMTSSRQLFHSMHRRYHVPKNKIVLFEDHIDTEAFAQREPDTALRDRLAMPKGAPVVAFIGSLDKLQGIDLLLDIAKIVAARAPQTYFLIMGYPDEKIWEDRFKHAGVFNCRFPGLVSRSEAPEYLSLGSVAVSAKRSGSSQANGKLLDYMAVGLPVVVFDDEINQDILGAYGAYATNGDIEGFAALVLDFINNPAACRKAGEGLRQRVCAQFSSKTHGKKLLDIYKAIISDDLSEVAADPRESP